MYISYMPIKYLTNLNLNIRANLLSKKRCKNVWSQNWKNEHQKKTNERDFIKLKIYTKTGIAKNTKTKTMEWENIWKSCIWEVN